MKRSAIQDGVLSGVGFSPQEEQSRHSRAGGNPVIPQSTGSAPGYPSARARRTGELTRMRKIRKIAENEKDLPLKGRGEGVLTHGTPVVLYIVPYFLHG